MFITQCTYKILHGLLRYVCFNSHSRLANDVECINTSHVSAKILREKYCLKMVSALIWKGIEKNVNFFQKFVSLPCVVQIFRESQTIKVKHLSKRKLIYWVFVDHNAGFHWSPHVRFCCLHSYNVRHPNKFTNATNFCLHCLGKYCVPFIIY